MKLPETAIDPENIKWGPYSQQPMGLIKLKPAGVRQESGLSSTECFSP